MSEGSAAALFYWIGIFLIVAGTSIRFGADIGAIAVGAGIIIFVFMKQYFATK